MYKLFYLLLIIFTYTALFAQEFEEHSIHEAHYNEFKNSKNQLSKFAADGSGIIPLQVNKQKELSKIVFGYMPDWEYISGAHANQRYDLLTHIATFDFMVSSSGSVGFPSHWPWTDLINAAHEAGTRVIMTAVNFDSLDIRNIINNEIAKQKFFSETKNIIETYQLDGVNVDFEGLHKNEKGASINNFIAELTSFIHSELPGKEVSFAGPPVNWGDWWDFDGLVQSCDHVFIMGYAFWYGGSSTSGPNAPLTGGIGGNYNITRTVTVDYGVPVSKYPEKVILGVPYYGHEWKTLTGNAYSSVIENGFQGSTRFYNDIDNVDIHGLLWDNVSRTSWFRWQEGTQWKQTWFDDVQSLDKKYELALAHNLGGVGMWALGYDGTKDELWRLLEENFLTSSVGDESQAPYEFVLHQNYPNPFNPSTTIKYSIPVGTRRPATAGSPHVTLQVFDILGREVAMLVNKEQSPGNYEVKFDAGNLTSGTYFFRITSGEFSDSKKMILLR